MSQVIFFGGELDEGILILENPSSRDIQAFLDVIEEQDESSVILVNASKVLRHTGSLMYNGRSEVREISDLDTMKNKESVDFITDSLESGFCVISEQDYFDDLFGTNKDHMYYDSYTPELTAIKGSLVYTWSTPDDGYAEVAISTKTLERVLENLKLIEEEVDSSSPHP